MVHVGEDFGGVLAVAVEKDDDVETALHEVPVAENLVAAVPLVLLVLEDLEFGVGVDLLVAESEGEGLVLAGVVKDDNLFNVLPDDIGDAAEDFGKSGGGVVSNDEDTDALALRSGKFRGSGRVFGRGVHRQLPLHNNAVERKVLTTAGIVLKI